MKTNGEAETMATTERNRERSLRRKASRLGFILNKRRGVANNWYGPNYWLLDDVGGRPVLHDGGDPRNRYTLDDVAAHLYRADQMEKNFDWDKAIFGR